MRNFLSKKSSNWWEIYNDFHEFFPPCWDFLQNLLVTLYIIRIRHFGFKLWILDFQDLFHFRARQKGYRVHCGRWLVEGNPQVVLFDIASASQKMNEFKQELYDKAGIGIPSEDIETNDVTIFG